MVPATPPGRLELMMKRLARGLAQGLVGMAFLGAAFVALGNQLGAERFWLLAFVQYLPFPIHLAPALIAVAASLALRPFWRLLALAALILVIGPVMGLELHAGEAAQGRRPVRVMTYNIKASLAALQPDGYARLAREVAAHDPDIVVAQDSGLPSALRRTLPSPADAVFGARHRYEHGQYTIASRYPLRECRPGTTAAGQPSDAYARCTVEIGGTAVDIFAVHFRTPRQALVATRREALEGVDDLEQNVADRMAQARDLALAVRAATHPVILGGDLNAPEASLVVRSLLDAGLRDAFSSAGSGYGYSYGHALPRPGFSFLRIDHVLVGPQIGVAACTVGGAGASQHRPVIADLLLSRPEATRTQASSAMAESTPHP
jgi:endonuclease/exonuclease/phosphatase (EEP) superfamily protein YafD